jgi:hypothetical protein
LARALRLRAQVLILTRAVQRKEKVVKLGHLIVGFAIALVAIDTTLSAAPADDLQSAVKKLAAAGYTWQAVSEHTAGDSKFSVTRRGKIDKDAVAVFTHTLAGNDTQVVVGKNGKGAVKTEEGWKSVAELTGNQQQPGRGRVLSSMVSEFQSPAVQATEMAAQTTELRKTDDGIAADLTEEGAKEQIAFYRPGTVKSAKGQIAYTIKDGVLVRIKYTIQGTISQNGDDREVERTTTIEISNIGSTKVEVPAEAKAKAGL